MENIYYKINEILKKRHLFVHHPTISIKAEKVEDDLVLLVHFMHSVVCSIQNRTVEKLSEKKSK